MFPKIEEPRVNDHAKTVAYDSERNKRDSERCVTDIRIGPVKAGRSI